MKKKSIYFAIFFTISIVISTVIYSLVKNLKDEHVENEKKLLEVTYNTIVEAFRVHSNIIYFNKIDIPEVKSIVNNIYNKDSNKDELRDKLYNQLNDMYNHMDEFKLKQLHFHLKNNESFLRFHRPNKYGDNLTGIRSTIEYVNKNHKPIHGFEEGRIFNGYRFVYPLEYKGKHIGSVETSVSMKSIIESLKKEFKDSYIDFIIKKSVVDKKVFKKEHSNYADSIIYKKYYHEKSISIFDNSPMNKMLLNYSKNSNLETIIEQEKLFSFFTKIDNIYYITTFLPIKNRVTNETIAYIIVSNQSNDFYKHLESYLLFWSLLIVIIAIIIYFGYRIDMTKGKLEHQDKILNKVQKIGRLGYWEFDIEKNRLILSDEVYSLIGIVKNSFELSYNNYLEYVHDEDRDRVNEIFNKSIKDRSNYQVEYRLITTDGEIKFINEDCHTVVNKNGDIVQMLGTIHDITSLKNYQIKIENSKKQFESLISHIPDVVYRSEIDDNLTILYANESIEAVTGYNLKEIKFNKTVSFASIIHPNDIKMVKSKIEHAIDIGLTNILLEYRIITKDNRNILVKNHIDIINGKRYSYIEGIISDITIEREAYNKLYNFINTQDNIVILTDGNVINFANQKFFTFLGFKDIDEFADKYDCICERFINGEKFFSLAKIKNGANWIYAIQDIPEEQRIVAMETANQVIHSFSVKISNFENNLHIVSFTDITKTILENIELEEKTIHDPLTKAYNREYFEKNYKNILELFKSDGNDLGVAMLDIDFFKRVNDAYGHNVGDSVLKELVEEIKRFSRKDDILIRWGGEEFLLLLKIDSSNCMNLALEHIRNSVEKHRFKDINSITCSIGSTVYIDNEDIMKSIKRADEALYKAKENGRNRVEINL